MTTETKTKTREGWGRPGGYIQQHYFRNNKSLCGYIAFYAGDLSSDRADGYCPECALILQTGSKKD